MDQYLRSTTVKLSFAHGYIKKFFNTILIFFQQGGNPAAVCLLKEDIPDETKQKLAMEINLSETAFVLPLPDDDVTRQDEDVFKSGKKFSLRWFTPITEVPLCGHATLASAAVLFFVMGNTKVCRSILRNPEFHFYSLVF